MTTGILPGPADVLLKLGGSLLGDLEQCSALAEMLGSEAKRTRIIVFPGGGPIDNYIETVDKQLRFPPVVHHNLCARAQDQTGLMFASMCENASFFTTPLEARRILDHSRLAVMLPSWVIIQLDVFEQTWDVTSDLMAAWFAEFFRVDRFAILTDVDGYIQGGIEGGSVVRETTAEALIHAGKTCIDSCTPHYLRTVGRRCDVLNGARIDVVRRWLVEDVCEGTRILPL